MLRLIKQYSLFLLCAPLIISCVSEEINKTSEWDRNGIRDTILKNRKVVRNCYSQILMKSGRQNLTGKVVFNFDIQPDGKAHNTQINDQQTTLHNKDLQSCIQSQFNTWRFPTPPDGKTISVTYPLIFNDTPARNMQQKMDRFQKIRKSKQ